MYSQSVGVCTGAAQVQAKWTPSTDKGSGHESPFLTPEVIPECQPLEKFKS